MCGLPYGRNGAQLLELGKAQAAPPATTDQSSRNGAQLLELGKVLGAIGEELGGLWSQWSPAFRAGKRCRKNRRCPSYSGRNGAQLLELGKARRRDARNLSGKSSQWSPAFRAGKSVPERYR